MTQPGSAPPAPVPARRPLRAPALAVLVLAAAAILTDAIALVLELVPSDAVVMQYVMQGFHLVLVVVGLLTVAAVLWLLAASRAGERRAGALALVALGLLTLSALLAPAAQLLTLLLQLGGVGGVGPGGYGVRSQISSVLTTAGGILLALALGVLALMLLLRPRLAERTAQVPVGPVPLAIVLLVTALGLAALGPLQGVLLDALTAGGGGVLTVSALLTTVRTLLAALLVPVLGLLLALTGGRVHVLLWAGFGGWALSQVVTAVLLRLYVLRLLGGAATDGQGLFLASGVVEVVGALLPAAAAAAVLGLGSARRSRHGQHRPVIDRDPIH
jgi:hypothetical protein